MRSVKTFTATIYVGLQERESGFIFDVDSARRWLQDYVNCGLCVTLTPTEFIYTNGGEAGFSVGLINYPRFPREPEKIREHAIKIALGLLQLFGQQKVSIVFPDETVMLERTETSTPVTGQAPV